MYIPTRRVGTKSEPILADTLAARGLEETWNSQELLIESVGPVSLFCVLCHIVPICCFSVELKYHIRT